MIIRPISTPSSTSRGAIRFGTTDSGRTRSDLFAGLFYRHASLRFDADPRDQPQFVFFPDLKDTFNLTEQRDANIYGVKFDYAYRPADPVEVKVGTLSSFVTRTRELFDVQRERRAPARILSDLTGHDIGVYAQTAYSPTESFELRTGMRYDAHKAPFAGTATQLSPRVRLNFYPSTAHDAVRLLRPPVHPDQRRGPARGHERRRRAATSPGHASPNGTTSSRGASSAASHRRDRREAVGVSQAQQSRIDDNTVPGSAIVTDVNIEHVRITGIEGVLEFGPTRPFAGTQRRAQSRLWLWRDHGGFFPVSPPSSAFDLDHDQRVSIVGSATYTFGRTYCQRNRDLRNGPHQRCRSVVVRARLARVCSTSTRHPRRAEHDPECGRGLFGSDEGHRRGAATLRRELFDRTYLLKGAFFSGPSVGRPRTIQLQFKAAF